MKQTIEIEVPDGKKAVWKDNKVVFEDIMPQLPKTWEEFCELYPKQEGEVYINGYSGIIKECSSSDRHPIESKNTLPSKEAAKQHIALMQLHQLRDCYRQGWKPDWMAREDFWCIDSIPKSDEKFWASYNQGVKKFLTFQTEELANEFLNNFRDLIEEAGDLI